jgi:hypothetical protein
MFYDARLHVVAKFEAWFASVYSFPGPAAPRFAAGYFFRLTPDS